MRAICFHGKERLSVDEIPLPRISVQTDVIVKVEAAGICGSDLHPYLERERGLDHGTVMGHEFVGRVSSVGTEVRGLKVGHEMC